MGAEAILRWLGSAVYYEIVLSCGCTFGSVVPYQVGMVLWCYHCESNVHITDCKPYLA